MFEEIAIGMNFLTYETYMTQDKLFMTELQKHSSKMTMEMANKQQLP